jgi:putative sterol carrier protein
MVSEPSDFVGNVLAKLVNRRLEADRQLQAKVDDYRMSVVVSTSYYPVTLHFNKGLRIEKGAAKRPTLQLELGFDTIVQLAQQRISPMRAVLTGQIKVKGLLRHPLATYRIYRLLMPALTG